MNSLSFLAVRLLSVYYLINGVIGLFSLPYLWLIDQEGHRYHQYLYLTNMLVPLIIGTLLWLFTRPLAQLVCPATGSNTIKTESDKIIATGSFLIGLFFLVEALPELYSAITQFISTSDHYYNRREMHQITASGIQIIVGFLLMAGQSFLVRVYRSFRGGA